MVASRETSDSEVDVQDVLVDRANVDTEQVCDLALREPDWEPGSASRQRVITPPLARRTAPWASLWRSATRSTPRAASRRMSSVDKGWSRVGAGVELAGLSHERAALGLRAGGHRRALRRARRRDPRLARAPRHL